MEAESRCGTPERWRIGAGVRMIRIRPGEHAGGVSVHASPASVGDHDGDGPLLLQRAHVRRYADPSGPDSQRRRWRRERLRVAHAVDRDERTPARGPGGTLEPPTLRG